ncbi:MAG: hypothetical protein EBZ78_00615 [Verrucomicrobia bacterium]|nr:hypothetical protein [Verrucomicrobiota bacterium]
MPCDSAAAGFVALGAMVRDLGDPQTNDVDGHYDKLLNYARQFLHSCKSCDLKCKPEIKRCGYAKEVSGRLRSPLHPRKTFEISPRSDVEGRKLAWQYTDGKIQWPNAEYAINWHIDGDPAPELKKADGQLQPDPYCSLIPRATIIPENLHRSYSGLCFAGRITGETAGREVCEQVRFSDGDSVWSLGKLLTINDWSDMKISRIAYFNSRTKKLDRNAAAPVLVIADGDVAFLSACDHPEFQSCDVIGVVHRTMEYERLEEVGIKMRPNLWFSPDIDTLCELPPNPRGISMAVLKRRLFQ